jgi:ABC-type branched-subunit amino acid transport system substrate-binding protein
LGIEIAQTVLPPMSNGDAVEILVEDDQGLPEETLAAMGRLAAKGVAAVLLLSPSNQALALTDSAAPYEIPIIATVATHPDITKVNQHMVQLCFDDEFQGSVAAMYLRDELFLQKAVVLSDPRDPHSGSLAETFIKKFTEAGGDIVYQGSVHTLGTNLEHRIERFNDQDAEILYLPVYASAVLEIAGAVRKSSWKPVIMVGDGLLAEILLDHPKDVRIVNGLFATDLHSHSEPKSSVGRKIYRSFRARVKGPDQQGSSFTVLASEGLQIIQLALAGAAPTYESEDILREIKQIRVLEGYAGLISIGQNRKAIRPVYVNAIRGGKQFFIVKVY